MARWEGRGGEWRGWSLRAWCGAGLGVARGREEGLPEQVMTPDLLGFRRGLT